ncbi:hypothetical protein F9U64_06440 [Gracilibacillus oryzae]|uniref:Uncharacterized protein n=2 Tax=Gracilibacillus oryzae TaxID=1672701 RepID=A0A7C8KTJ0_9BACI|nr:hypothetical protein F9U64_06440 [Gracilibacillus oryzae]
MRLLIKSVICSIVIHVVVIAIVIAIIQLFHRKNTIPPDISARYENVEILQSEVAFGFSFSPMIICLSFTLISFLSWLVFKMLQNSNVA